MQKVMTGSRKNKDAPDNREMEIDALLNIHDAKQIEFLEVLSSFLHICLLLVSSMMVSRGYRSCISSFTRLNDSAWKFPR